MYICIYVYIQRERYMCIYIYIQRERYIYGYIYELLLPSALGLSDFPGSAASCHHATDFVRHCISKPCIYIYIYIYTYTYTYTYIRTHTYILTVYTYNIYIYIYICLFMYIYIYIYTYLFPDSVASCHHATDFVRNPAT